MRLVLVGVVAVLILPACSPVSATNGAEPASVFDSTPAYPGYVRTRNGHTVSPEEIFGAQGRLYRSAAAEPGADEARAPMRCALTINGERREIEVAPSLPLLWAHGSKDEALESLSS
jgi:hypothetical protein